MIEFNDALKKVLDHAQDYGKETVSLDESQGRVLAENIIADRDFPPFDRSTKDGIAIQFDAIKSQGQTFGVSGMAQAGTPQILLENSSNCTEVMTGAIVPKNADTVIMYEHTSREGDIFTVNKPIKKGQNIHYQASDINQGEVLLQSGVSITSAEIGILASVGKAQVVVKKLPKIAVISTGNELVNVEEIPLPFQIRKSNSHSLYALLETEHIAADIHHLVDEPTAIQKALEHLIKTYDVLLLSGGVSMGKFDFLPEAFAALGVEKAFHKVLQRPGKPFWFGKHLKHKTILFSFPGNPVSTFVNYHLYFKAWLNKTLGREAPQFAVLLTESFTNETDLTLFLGAKIDMKEGRLMAEVLSSSGSGDLVGLSKVDGFVSIPPKESLQKEAKAMFIPTRNLWQ
ncbi:molybdopterin molybdotransferase MoeA [Flagellimonas alvinocaridis]|uniref:Molybdopterin molybdenumtransferase n=1 Tax=Flagellimonas alvinocaridis TaxID=2530200 RepID=A0A4V6T762_9FLAO|nr:molybdopterin molybdotransferase MoeA [Allomuricauda alvinocaridis]THV57106.1 molybdopterin molybdotransferase MoeA [Allomuricauda alvinocaridis]